MSTVAAFRSTVVVPTIKPPHDFNGDGQGDILLRSTAGDNAIWFMNGATLSSVSSLSNVPTNWIIQNAAAN